MMDGTNLNVLQTSRQMLRAFGGLNEGYGCSEAEFSGEMNFSSRGYPGAADAENAQECADGTGCERNVPPEWAADLPRKDAGNTPRTKKYVPVRWCWRTC